MGKAYNQNLFFYVAFVACLTGYIFALYGGNAIRTRNVFFEEVCSSNSSDAPPGGRYQLGIILLSGSKHF